nr:PKD domain-containing protein [Candidatus Sigynarchaeota archaeon]
MWGPSDDITDHYGNPIFYYDGLLYSVGYTTSSGAGTRDGLLLAYDLNGNIRLNTTYGGALYDQFTNLYITNGVVYACGCTQNFGAIGNDGWMCKIFPQTNLVPSATFTANVTSIIAGQSVSFTHTGSNGNTPATYQWSFGDGTANATMESPVHQFTTTGTRTVRLTVTDVDGDSNSYTLPSTINVAVDLAPSATFTASTTTIIAGQVSSFTHTGSNGNTPSTYQWNFGDGTANETSENPIHQFTTPGNRTVRLTVVDADGDSNSYTLLATIDVAPDLTPDAIFTANMTSIIAGQSVSFTHAGSNGNAPATYQWDFGDGTANATVENPVHQFTTAGTRTVRITLVDRDGDSVAYTLPGGITVAVDLAPSATFTANVTSIIAGQFVSFTHTGSNGNTPAMYQWNFGDGTANATTENPVHQFTSAATRTVRLTVTDADGDSVAYTLPGGITVAADLTPTAIFTANVTSIVEGQSVSFTHTGSNGNTPATYQWNFGDGTANATVENPVHQFLLAGTRTVRLTVTDVDGDSNSYTLPSTIDVAAGSVPSGIFTANVTSIVAGQFVSFTHIGSNGNVPATYQWSFGDGTANATVENPVHQFTTAGTRSVRLTVTDVDGDSNSYTLPSTINVTADVNPSATFTSNVTSIVAGQSVSFTHSGSNGNAPATYQWSFGDGTANSTFESPVHQYTSAGTRIVRLTVTDVDGDSNSYTLPSTIDIVADLTPSASFTTNTTSIIESQCVSFTHIGSNGNTPATYQWSFGDGTTNATVENPVHQFLLVGTRTVCLTVTDADGDSNTYTLPTIINVTAFFVIVVYPQNTTYTNLPEIPLNYTTNAPVASARYLLDNTWSIPGTNTTIEIDTFRNDSAFFNGPHVIQVIVTTTSNVTFYSALRWFTVQASNITGAALQITMEGHRSTTGQNLYNVKLVVKNVGTVNLRCVMIFIAAETALYSYHGIIPLYCGRTVMQPGDQREFTFTMEIRQTTTGKIMIAMIVLAMGYRATPAVEMIRIDDSGNFFLNLIILLSGSVGGVVVVGVVSRRVYKAGKKKQGAGKKGRSTYKPIDQGPPQQTGTPVVKSPEEQAKDKLDRMWRINEPATGSEVLASSAAREKFLESMKEAKTATAGKKAFAQPQVEEHGIKGSVEELFKLESEMKVDANLDKCLVCKNDLSGDVFICPSCKNAKYHQKCVEPLVERGEPCWICKQPFATSEVAKEIETLRYKLGMIQKAIGDLAEQLKQNTITHDFFTTTIIQLSKDKEEIEKQIKSRLTS